jgi:nickel-dependent lactate racemase
MDRTLYQAQKAIENGKLALKDGGTLILVSNCQEGIGQSKFWDLLTSDHDPQSVLLRIGDGYKLGYHKAARIVQLVSRARLMMVSSIPRSELSKGFIQGHSSISQALDDLGFEMTDKRALIVPDGTVTVPMVH